MSKIVTVFYFPFHIFNHFKHTKFEEKGAPISIAEPELQGAALFWWSRNRNAMRLWLRLLLVTFIPFENLNLNLYSGVVAGADKKVSPVAT
jgi:hypothetical protein